MNINNLTIKAQEVLQSAMNLARSDRNQAVEPLHMLDAIVAEDDSVGVFLLQKLGVNVGALRSVLRQQVERLPKVEGGEVYFSRESSEAIQKAGDFTKTFGDKYASVEHLLLGILTERSEASRLLKDAGATEKELVAAIKELRKGATVDSQTSEQEYDALGKYAINLNEQARKGKLDPVRKTTRFWSASLASAKRPSPKASRTGSSTATCRKTCAASRSTRSTWVR